MVKLYNQLIIGKQSRRKHLIDYQNKHIGFDTETYKGKAFLICSSNAYNTIHKNSISKSRLLFDFDNDKAINEILDFFTQSRFRKNMLWFYNLDYDVRAILKHMPEDIVLELYNKNKCYIDEYKISYLPHKLFSITINGNSYRYYDIYQFYRNKLDDNAKKYLDDKKIDFINSERLSYDKKYWIEQLPIIIDYCYHDAFLTGKLAALFYQKMWNVMTFSTKKPYSTGSIAQEYFLHKCYIPTIKGIPERVVELAQNSYRGGRIELLKRGYYKNVYSYDIKSAYPSIMRNLLDYSYGQWYQTKDCNMPNAGIYVINIEWDNDYISPFSQIYLNNTVYANGEFQIIVNEQEIDFLNQYHKYNSYEIIEGWEFTPYEKKYPFKKEIDFLFEQKEKSIDKMEKLIYKLYINSIYGKTAQAIDIRDKTEKSEVTYKTGCLWNPIYASRITSLTRLQLLKFAMPYIKHTLGFFTDSIHTTKKIHVSQNPGIGDFTEEFIKAEEISLMAGVRWNKYDDDESQKLRGFNDRIYLYDEQTRKIDKSIKLSLYDLLDNNRDKIEIPIKIEKPVTIYESLKTQNYGFGDMNIFTLFDRNLNINGDIRRFWEDDFNCADECFYQQINSCPIYI